MRMKKLSCIFMGLIVVMQMQAQNASWSKAKSPNGLEYNFVKNDPMKARFYTLKNGLTVILSENKETPRLQTIIATKAGSKTDPKDHTGLAHYLEHMLFKGTDKYGSLNWAKEKPLLDKIDVLYAKYNRTKDEAIRTTIYHEIDSVSGEAAKFAIANEYDKMMSMLGAKGTNAFTSFEQTAYINDIPSNQIDRWLAVEAERFRNPVLRIFHTELEAVYEEKNRSLDDDGDKVAELLFAKLFQKHNYGQQTTIGTIEHLKNPSLTSIREYFYKNYVPNNMCIIMAGDFNSDELIGKIDQAFAYMKPKPVAAYQFEKEQEITSPIEASVYGPDAEYVSIAFRFPGANTNDAMMLNFMSSVLSNGNAGLMDLNLVKKQEVLEASAGAYTLKDYSVLFIDGKAKEGQKLEDVKKMMLSQIGLLQSGNFDDEILKAIINNYKKSLIQKREQNGGRAFGLLESFTSEVPWDKSVSELEFMTKITKKDIQSFAKKWLNENYVCIYKRSGKDENTEKVKKPAITPVAVNRDAESDFVKKISTTPAATVKPVFVNYEKDIQRNVVKSKTNSVSLLSVRNKTNELFTQYYYVEMGALHNKLFPIAMDYLQYLGTDKYSAEEISKKFYTLACDFGVSANQEESYVYLNGLQGNYNEGITLFEHLLKSCKGDEQALLEMIAGIKKKRSDTKLNKNMIRSGLRSYAQYGARNPFNNELTNEELDNLKAIDLTNILHQLTAYPHKVLYFGPEDGGAISAKLSSVHEMPNSFLTPPEAMRYEFQNQKSNEVIFADYDMVQAEVQWFRNGETYNPDAVPTINMFNEYFGGNMSGIVFQEIRESKALAYSTFASYGTPQRKGDPFSMTAYVGCQADKMKEAIGGMQELLMILPKSEKLFSNSKASLRNSISTSRTTKTGILFSYLNAMKRGLNFDMNEKVYNAIDKMKFADIEQFFNQNISKKPYTLTVVGNDKKMNWDELNKFGSVKKLALKEIFGY
jgi:predicted Zn-dependent peptidase